MNPFREHSSGYVAGECFPGDWRDRGGKQINNVITNDTLKNFGKDEKKGNG